MSETYEIRPETVVLPKSGQTDAERGSAALRGSETGVSDSDMTWWKRELVDEGGCE
jgi:hypothetical protein